VDVVGIGTIKPRLRRHAAVVEAGNHAAVARVILGLHAHITAQLEAGIRARNVVEAVPVQAADLHVLDRRDFPLYGHFGSLCPSDRNESRGSTEKKTFHHLHLNLHRSSWEGSVSVGRCSLWKVPDLSVAVCAPAPD